uniref:Headcase N-terminal domain-containing protein n=1 Tax=Setaria digitata TaxID=48799 RepID=A0A915PZB7_9BILA
MHFGVEVTVMGSSRKANDTRDMNRKSGCPIPLPSGCLRGLPLPSSFEEGIKMKCSNTQCPYQDQLMHPECFHTLEDNLIKIMSNLGSARGWTDAQRRSNLWDKKGLSLIQRKCRCLCGLGLMRLDETAMFLANRNATPLPIAPPKTKKGKKNLPRLNFGNGSTNVPTVQHCTRYTKLVIMSKKRGTHFRSISPSDSPLSASSSLAKYSHGSEHRSLSHTFRRGKWDSEAKNTKSEYGWKKSISPATMEKKSFFSKKVDGSISYAEATLVKHDSGFVFNESQFPKAEDVESGTRSLSFCMAFSDFQVQNFDIPQSHPLLDSVDLSTNTSTVSFPYEDFQNSVHYSISSDDTSETRSYYHYDATEFFISPFDFSMILPSPPETPSGSLSFTDDSQVLSQKDDALQDIDDESTGYYSLFAGYSFRLGEILIAESYLPGLL